MVDEATGPLQYNGRPVKTIAYVYCVGSRQDESLEGAAPTARALLYVRRAHRARAAGSSSATFASTTYRDMRPTASTSCCGMSGVRRAALYLRVPDDEPPAVESSPPAAWEGRPPRTCSPAAKRSRSRPTSSCSSPAWCRARTPSWSASSSYRWATTASTTRSTPSCAMKRSWTACSSAAPAGAHQDLVRGRRRRPGRRHRRRHVQTQLRRARPHGGDRRQRSLHLVRQVPTGLPLRRDRRGRGRRQAGRPGHQDGLQGLRRLRAGLPTDAVDLQEGYSTAQIRTMIDGLMEVSCS